MGGIDNKRVSEGAILKFDERIKAELEVLRNWVDNFNKVDLKLSLTPNDTYKSLSAAEVFTTKVDGWEFGYKLEEYPTFMRRKVYVKAPEPFDKIPEHERKPVVAAVYEACLDRGSGEIDVQLVNTDCLLITQDFALYELFEKNPRVLTP